MKKKNKKNILKDLDLVDNYEPRQHVKKVRNYTRKLTREDYLKLLEEENSLKIDTIEQYGFDTQEH